MTRNTLLGIALNVIFVLSIFTIRYRYAKKEYDFLQTDSARQEQLITKNKTSIDSLSTIITQLQIDNDTQFKTLSTELYNIVRWSTEYEQRLQN